MYIYIPLIIFNLLAVIFILLGVFFLLKEHSIKKNAHTHTQGQVIKYALNQSMQPIVEYKVNNQTYKKRLRYTIVSESSTPFNKVKSSATTDLLATTLHIKKNSMISVNTLMRDNFPVGSTMNVYYNPANPQQAFVERYAKTYLPLIFICSGILTVILSIILALILL